MANNNRFADAIRRIVEPLIKKDDTTTTNEEKVGLLGKRGIAYTTANGAVNSATGAVGSAKASLLNQSKNGITSSNSDDTEAASTDAAKNALGFNGGSQGRYSGDDLLDGKGVMDGITDAMAQADLLAAAANSAGGTVSGSSQLREITDLYTNAMGTGTKINVRTDGMFVGPPTWDDANSPPLDPTYEAGKVYCISLGGGSLRFFGNTWSAAKAAVIAAYPTQALYTVNAGFSLITSTNPQPGDYMGFGASGKNVGDATTGLSGILAMSPFYSAGVTVTNGRSGQQDCGIETGNPSASVAACSASAPYETSWPLTGTAQLSLLNGRVTHNQYDSEVPLDLQQEQSTINLFTASGKPIRIQPTRSGGFMVMETSGGAPIGNVKLFNSDKSYAGTTDAAGVIEYIPQ